MRSELKKQRHKQLIELISTNPLMTDEEIAVSLIIALIVENPTAQLKLLRRLFSELQNPNALEALMTTPSDRLATLFRETILEPENCEQAS